MMGVEVWWAAGVVVDHLHGERACGRALGDQGELVIGVIGVALAVMIGLPVVHGIVLLAR
jgi:hypothetical protein